MTESDALRVVEPLARLRDPILVLCYAGWSDAGEAATHAGRYLAESLSMEKIAEIDPEEFLDFTVVRPHTRWRGGEREIVWPGFQLYAHRSPLAPRDLVIGVGVEPHTRWKTYCASMLDFLRKTRIQTVVMLAALFDEVIYSQPVPVSGFSTDAAGAERLGLSASRYEGPTGIVGVLGDALHRQGIRTVSLWARLPHYVSQTPYTRGSLALLQRFESLAQYPLELGGLEKQALEFDVSVSEMISNDPQLSAYVRELKRRAFAG